jgi:hypothetical protein
LPGRRGIDGRRPPRGQIRVSNAAARDPSGAGRSGAPGRVRAGGCGRLLNGAGHLIVPAKVVARILLLARLTLASRQLCGTFPEHAWRRL